MSASAEIVLDSQYVQMTDGVQLAASTWRHECSFANTFRPAILVFTRYWRASAVYPDDIQQNSYYPLATQLARAGYVLCTVDVRGSGASFGTREAELSTSEVEDLNTLIQWAARQPWCDGRVVTTGTSYSANLAVFSTLGASTPLRLAVCRAPDFDLYRHLLSPGGIVNRWFIDAWGAATKAMDLNDVDGLVSGGYWPTPKENGPELLGVRPVGADPDGANLQRAISEHYDNYNVASSPTAFTFADEPVFDDTKPVFDEYYRAKLEALNVPTIILCGWYDAGTALGALNYFASTSGPVRIKIGPWNHEGSYVFDPLAGEQSSSRVSNVEKYHQTLESISQVLEGATPLVRSVDYYILGEGVWKTTSNWPIPGTSLRHFYLSANNKLHSESPSNRAGHDQYIVDQSATTGRLNRWHAQSPEQPIVYQDRSGADKKLIVYDSDPLSDDTEITGHPIVCIWLRSTHPDANIFAYLEIVDTDGSVVLLTEGQLRLIHRKESDNPPYAVFGPFHSFSKDDAVPMKPGSVERVRFELFPISALLRKGQRIRLAISGADADTFGPAVTDDEIRFCIERNKSYPSYIQIPTVSRGANA